MYCKTCGAEINDKAVICVHCGCATHEESLNQNQNQNQNPNQIPAQELSPKNGVTTLLLCFFLGAFGVHSFYVGKIGIGLLQLFTLGGCGIWVLIDFILIVTGSYKDEDGKVVRV